MRTALHIGTAGWVVPARSTTTKTHLQRYSAQLQAAEINSAFHRHHRLDTYRRWAGEVAAQFRFAVKIPKAITHENGLRAYREVLDRFLDEVSGLGRKLGVLLVQLPPKLEFDARVAGRFFRELRSRVDVGIACEPRHRTWSLDRANDFLASHRVARVAADPPLWEGGDEPGGWDELVYYRQHGSPRIYYSNYDDEALHRLRSRLKQAGAANAWCIFDNTVLGCAYANALTLQSLVREVPGRRGSAAGAHAQGSP